MSTRTELQRVATHLLARRRFAAEQRIGLVVTPGGFSTPPFGPGKAEYIAVSGTNLNHEFGGTAVTIEMEGATLKRLAEMIGVDLTGEFSAGEDTPPLGEVDAPLTFDRHEVALITDWFALGWRIVETVANKTPSASAIQLWPEHFDLGCSVAAGSDRCNLGASPGDSFSEEPYLYVGPWTADRPGDPDYWNAPFGAVLRRSEVPDVATGVGFLRRGLDLLGAAS